MLQHIIDSATGEEIGSIIITGMDDEDILQYLCRAGYLDGSPDLYDITRSYPFAEGEILVIDLELRQPVLKLELPDMENAA